MPKVKLRGTRKAKYGRPKARKGRAEFDQVKVEQDDCAPRQTKRYRKTKDGKKNRPRTKDPMRELFMRGGHRR